MNILKRPMLYAVLICSLVSVLTLYYINPLPLIAAAILFFVFIVIKYRSFKYIMVLVAVIGFVASLNVEVDKINTVNSFDGDRVKGKFLVLTEPTFNEKYSQMIFKVTESDNIPKDVKLSVYAAADIEYEMGSIITAELTVNSIDEYKFYNYGNGVYGFASVISSKDVNEYNAFYRFCGNVQKYVKNTFSKFEGDSAGLMLAITTGDKSLLSDEFSDNIKETGISHVVVVSGMHLAIIMTAVFSVFDRLLNNKYLRAVLSVIIVLIISGICGNTMSILRAGLMFIIGAFAPIFNRENDLLSSLLTAVSLLLIFTPFAIVNVSFLLSVLATLAIVWVLPFYSKLIAKKLKIKSKLLITLIEMLFVTIFAMIFTLPVVIFCFGYVSIIAPITNILVTYIITFSLVLNCVGLILSLMPIANILGAVILCLSNLCCELIVFTVNILADLPITIAIIPKSFVWLAIALIALIIFYMYLLNYQSKKGEGISGNRI